MQTVRPAGPADVEPAGRTLAAAFHDDPVMSWLFPDDARRVDRLSRFFGYAVRHRPGTVWTTDHHAGAAVWAPPGAWRTKPSEVLSGIPFFTRLFGRRLPGALRLLSMIEKAHPDEPHWYLVALGTEPARQGTGVGSALLRPVLDRCDDEGVPAYLESSKPSNIAFYARHGFEVTGELTLRDGPTVWPMWRDPRPADRP